MKEELGNENVEKLSEGLYKIKYQGYEIEVADENGNYIIGSIQLPYEQE